MPVATTRLLRGQTSPSPRTSVAFDHHISSLLLFYHDIRKRRGRVVLLFREAIRDDS